MKRILTFFIIAAVILMVTALYTAPPASSQSYLDFYATEVDGTSVKTPNFSDGGDIGFTATGSTVTGHHNTDSVDDTHVDWGSGANQVEADDVPVTLLTGSTYDDLQDYINIYGSRGLISGGEVSDNGDGTVDVAAGTAWLRVSDTALASLPFADFDAEANLALTDQLTNYIYADYNDGVTILVLATTNFAVVANDTRALIAITFRDGNDIHITHLANLFTDIAGKVNLKDFERFGISRAAGLNISSANRTVVITSGTIWGGLQRTTSAGFDTGASDVFTAWYTTDSGSSWTKVANQTEISNTQYNDITSGLASLTGVRNGVHWVYVDFDGADLHVVYGQDNYIAAQAEAAGVPSVLPPIIVNYSVLVGKVIIQKDAITMEALSPFETTFTSSLATDHGSLAGLGDDDHTQYVQTTDVVSRGFQIKGCSLNSDLTNDITAQELVAFTGGTLCVSQWDKTSGDVGTFAFELPATWGQGGTTTFTYHVQALTQTESSGTLVVSLKAATSLAGLSSASAVTSTVTFTASDDVTKSVESAAVTIFDAGTAQAGDWFLIEIQTTSASTVAENAFIEDIVGTYSGV